MIKYCTYCLYPETKPDLWFDDYGVCSACLAFEQRSEVAKVSNFFDLIIVSIDEAQIASFMRLCGGSFTVYACD